MTTEPAVSLKASVLIVDPSDECRDVIQTVLEGRGYRTMVAADARRGLELLREFQPGVVVLDSDTESAGEGSWGEQYAAGTRLRNAKLLVLGRSARWTAWSAGERVIEKPYHFGPLIRTIERLARR